MKLNKRKYTVYASILCQSILAKTSCIVLHLVSINTIFFPWQMYLALIRGLVTYGMGILMTTSLSSRLSSCSSYSMLTSQPVLLSDGQQFTVKGGLNATVTHRNTPPRLWYQLFAGLQYSTLSQVSTQMFQCPMGNTFTGHVTNERSTIVSRQWTLTG